MVYGIQPSNILFYAVVALDKFRSSNYTICKHFDPSVDAATRYYEFPRMNRVYDLNGKNLTRIFQPIIDNSCIGESPGKNMDKCEFNGYLHRDELCNPCKVHQFKERCPTLCETTTGLRFGAYYIRCVTYHM